MKKLIFIALVVLSACGNCPPDHKAVVTLNHTKYPSDTIVINYYESLSMGHNDSHRDDGLMDGNGSYFGECESFSILEEVKLERGKDIVNPSQGENVKGKLEGESEEESK